MDPRGCRSGRVSRSSQAKRAGLTPALPRTNCATHSHMTTALWAPNTWSQHREMSVHRAVARVGDEAASKQPIVHGCWCGR